MRLVQKQMLFKEKATFLPPLNYLIYTITVISFWNALISEDITASIVVFLVFLPLAILIYLATDKTLIDLDERFVIEKKAFGKREKVSFEKITKVFVNKVNQSQTVSSRISSTTIKHKVFVGFITLDDKHKVRLVEHKDKNKVLSSLKELAEHSELSIVDRTI